VELVAILGLAGLLFVKEAGVPIPIPGDLLVLGAGVATAGNPATAVVALVAILIAGFVGGSPRGARRPWRDRLADRPSRAAERHAVRVLG
jgi:hypothetical protein